MMPIENLDDEDQDEDVKLAGKFDVTEVHRILKPEPAEHKDETYIQRRVRKSAETAMNFMDSDNSYALHGL